MAYDQIIYSQAISDGMPPVLAKLIVAQAMHETANFTSNVFHTCNNAFGYKWVGQSYADGPCSQSPEGDAYAKYGSIQQSTHELTQWIRRRQNQGVFPQDLNEIQTPYDYATLLNDAGYFGSGGLTTYYNALVSWLNHIGTSLDNLSSTQKGGMGLLVLVGLALIFRKKIFGS